MLEPRHLLELALEIVGLAAIYISRRQLVEGLNEAFNNFRGGGPRPPTHPLPANDALILKRKRRPQ